jgi:hypothetical protein
MSSATEQGFRVLSVKETGTPDIYSIEEPPGISRTCDTTVRSVPDCPARRSQVIYFFRFYNRKF